MSFISIETSEHIGIVTIAREKKLNALNTQVIEELSEAFKSLAKNPDIRAVILIGSGPKAFVAGADISGFPGLSAAQGQA